MLLSNLALLAIDRLDLLETPSLIRPNRIQRMKVGIWINFKRLIEEFGSAQPFLTPHSARNNYRYGPELLRRRTSPNALDFYYVYRNARFFPLILARLNLVKTKGYGVRATTIEGQIRFCSNAVLCVSFTSKHAWSDYNRGEGSNCAWSRFRSVHSIILSGSPNEAGYIRVMHA